MSIVVVKIGGAALDNAADLAPTWSALLQLHNTLREATPDHAGGVVLVHGGGAKVDDLTRAVGKEPVKRDGIRVTPADQIPLVVSVLAGQVSVELCSMIQNAGGIPVGLTLASAGLTSVRNTSYDFDAGYVGKVNGGYDVVLRHLFQSGALPVVSSIGIDEDGSPLNINADDAAAGLAQVVGAQRLALLTNVPGVLDAKKQRIDELDSAAINTLIEDGTIHSGMIPKVKAALIAAEASNVPALIASWADEHAVAHLHEAGVGTLIVPE